jgi:hypothetical protein
MKRLLFPVIVMIALSMVGCATGYNAKGLMGGFSETQLDTDLFTVSFKGNGYTSVERASDFALLRCADLTLQNGFTYFKVVDSQSNIHTTYNVTSDTNFNASSYGSNLYGSSSSNTTVHEVNRPAINMTIRLLKDKADGAYNANFIGKSIRTKYRMDQ